MLIYKLQHLILKVTEVENKIKDADVIAKSVVTKANTIRSDLTDYAKKADYVSNASLTSQLNNLKINI